MNEDRIVYLCDMLPTVYDAAIAIYIPSARSQTQKK